jgi:hypothetical protein
MIPGIVLNNAVSRFMILFRHTHLLTYRGRWNTVHRGTAACCLSFFPLHFRRMHLPSPPHPFPSLPPLFPYMGDHHISTPEVQTDIHAPKGIRTRESSVQAALDRTSAGGRQFRSFATLVVPPAHSPQTALQQQLADTNIMPPEVTRHPYYQHHQIEFWGRVVITSASYSGSLESKSRLGDRLFWTMFSWFSNYFQRNTGAVPWITAGPLSST